MHVDDEQSSAEDPDVSPEILPAEEPTSVAEILDKWALTPTELSEIVAENPSLRGMMFGYIAEYKARKMWFSDPVFTNLRKPDDHDRTRKGDFIFT